MVVIAVFSLLVGHPGFVLHGRNANGHTAEKPSVSDPSDSALATAHGSSYQV